MIWQPPLHPPAVALGVLAATAVCVILALTARARRPRRAAVVALRLIALATLLAILLGPSMDRTTNADRPARNIHVLVDVSPSMTTESPSRFEQAAAMFGRLPDPVRWWAFADAVEQTADPPTRTNDDAQGTALFNAARTVANAAEPGDVILAISDGHDTTDTSVRLAAGTAQARGIRFFALPVGRVDRRRVIVTANPKRVFTGEPVELRIAAAGFDRDEPIRVDRDGQTVGQGTVGRIESLTDVPFEDAGENQVATYRVTAGLENPVSTAATVTNLGRRLRVLMVEGEPNWNSRFVAEALRGDTHVDLTTVQALSPKRHVVFRYTPEVAGDDQGPGVSVPLTADDLADFDVVVTGHSLGRCMTEQAIESLSRQVAAGGGLVMIGRPVTTFQPVPATVAGASLDLAYGRIGAGRVIHVIDAQVWRSLFASADDQTWQSAMATLRAATRWAAIGDPTPPNPVPPSTESAEMLDTTVRPETLEQLATATGGQVLEASNLQPLFDALAEPRDAAPPDPADLQPAWPRPWVFALLIVPLIAEWFIRRTGGMP